MEVRFSGSMVRRLILAYRQNGQVCLHGPLTNEGRATAGGWGLRVSRMQRPRSGVQAAPKGVSLRAPWSRGAGRRGSSRRPWISSRPRSSPKSLARPFTPCVWSVVGDPGDADRPPLRGSDPGPRYMWPASVPECTRVYHRPGRPSSVDCLPVRALCRSVGTLCRSAAEKDHDSSGSKAAPGAASGQLVPTPCDGPWGPSKPCMPSIIPYSAHRRPRRPHRHTLTTAFRSTKYRSGRLGGTSRLLEILITRILQRIETQDTPTGGGVPSADLEGLIEKTPLTVTKEASKRSIVAGVCPGPATHPDALNESLYLHPPDGNGRPMPMDPDGPGRACVPWVCLGASFSCYTVKPWTTSASSPGPRFVHTPQWGLAVWRRWWCTAECDCFPSLAAAHTGYGMWIPAQIGGVPPVWPRAGVPTISCRLHKRSTVNWKQVCRVLLPGSIPDGVAAPAAPGPAPPPLYTYQSRLVFNAAGDL